MIKYRLFILDYSMGAAHDYIVDGDDNLEDSDVEEYISKLGYPGISNLEYMWGPIGSIEYKQFSNEPKIRKVKCVKNRKLRM